MTEYIERDALLDDISAAVKHRGMGEIIGQTLMRYVKRQPAADVAPVVRCKNCRSYNKPKTGWCEVHLDREHPDDFCGYGEQKDGGASNG